MYINKIKKLCNNLLKNIRIYWPLHRSSRVDEPGDCAEDDASSTELYNMHMHMHTRIEHVPRYCPVAALPESRRVHSKN